LDQNNNTAIEQQDNQPLTKVERRNFFGGLWHGAFLAMGMSFTQPSTVISAFIAELTGSTVWVGGLSTVLAVASALPQIFVARWVEPKKKKMPFLLLAIYLRVASWGLLAWLVYTIGAGYPNILAWVTVVLMAVFYAGGGLGNIPYTDIIGKVIPVRKRGAFFGGRQMLGAPLAVGAALFARRILSNVAYPSNYALLFGLAAASLLVASIGFWIIKEPPAKKATNKALPWGEYIRQIIAASKNLGDLVIVQLLTGFSLMALPFYVVYARENLGAPTGAVGWFLLAQVLGGVLSNIVWARLVDRTSSARMLTVCATLSAITPLLAILIAPFGWEALLIIFFLAGATFNGRSVGFGTALLTLAPEEERPTYAGLNEVLALPIAFLPLLAGWLLHFVTYQTLFIIVAAFIAVGAFWTLKLKVKLEVPS
jgi:MFS family permease